ncbi:MAG: methionyl-tRNA formyltransferase [Meiothermus sp.]|uniref:methionyl-tRNA formyltransferase n=1 Tax=Meiothermus sp. TaxID=1955249 RepID=UPI0025F413BD|nr:methionyl-tRNA formyltransferase [Meiothermus sp.]MCS7057838.1 methionyl-tRNA formyltransferase [Meiothermus sp.]MCS7194585.1 methionyl-tRNA formyltransferase [Meiothermus sp.]MCX7739419.1 methionyl-tRNA formyltransferase [Meiothermus sp.]MDW8090780.1 methionyl-tRNA formyltransferase [Meiothermus sp.]MDW8480797.1 methionyl-tRNA formyltransferase [Meiothermus sp.]
MASHSLGRRLAFFGSPAWAVPVLEALCRHHQVVLVVTQPDKPAGRGLKLTPCPVAVWAEERGLRVEKPPRLRKNPQFLSLFKELALEVAVTAAYGKILPAELLEVPRYGFLNLHPSDLPKYRGPAPVQWTLINGETETAVCIMQTDVGMDTGPVVARWRTPVGPDETAPELSERLRDKGIELLLAVLADLEHLQPIPQPPEGTHAPMLQKDDGKIVWERTAQEIYNRHRGVQPWPGSWLEFRGRRVRVLALRKEELPCAAPPATVIRVAPGVTVAAGQGCVTLLEVQPEGKRPMSAAEWARGARISVGERLA